MFDRIPVNGVCEFVGPGQDVLQTQRHYRGEDRDIARTSAVTRTKAIARTRSNKRTRARTKAVVKSNKRTRTINLEITDHQVKENIIQKNLALPK